MSRKFKSLLNLTTLTDDPITAIAGDVYFNTISKNIKIYNGLAWVDLTPGSVDPAPFYMHTHTYDGDVHTITIDDKVTFGVNNDINNEDSVTEEIPAIIGFDGGTPSSTYDDPSYQDLTLLDGGNIGN
jgi:hypothetical protein